MKSLIKDIHIPKPQLVEPGIPESSAPPIPSFVHSLFCGNTFFFTTCISFSRQIRDYGIYMVDLNNLRAFAKLANDN